MPKHITEPDLQNYPFYAFHDGSDYPARPNVDVVIWVGPTEPTEWVGNDFWYDKSEPSAATVPATMSAPTGVAGDESVVLSWVAPSNGGATITGYEIIPYIGASPQTPITTGNVLTYEITSLVNDTTYTFTIAAINSVGTGTHSPASSTLTPEAPESATVPDPPTNVAGTPGDTTVTLTWDAPADDGGATISAYTITPYIGASPQTPIVVGNVEAYEVTDLTNDTAYTFTVIATNSIGASDESTASAEITPVASGGGTFADIALVQTKTNHVQPSATTNTVTLDSTPTVGNVMFAMVTAANNGTITAPAGWTERATAGSTGQRTKIFTRTVQGGDGTSYVFTPGASAVSEATIAEFSGVDTTNPVEGSPVYTEGVNSSSNLTVGPTATSANPKSAGLAVIGLNGNTIFSNSWTNGFTKFTGAGDLYQACAYKIENSSPGAYSTNEAWTATIRKPYGICVIVNSQES